MAKFRLSEPEESIPESIVLMFRDLNRDPSIKFLYSHQDKILDQYFTSHINKKDVAIELPTGTGKTLVGLLIAEYRRRAFKEKVVFLCPTKQLCFQVAERASRYGINASVLVGPQPLYNQADFYKYQQGKSIAITTYSGIFNTNPRIENPDSIICDDAHAADNYVASLWTVSIDSTKNSDLYMALYIKIKDNIPDNVKLAVDFGGSKFNVFAIDLVSNISLSLCDKFKDIVQVVESFLDKYKYLKYPWGNISSNLQSCLFYITPEKIEIRPFIPPTQNHLPFFQAKQHVYMSATFGEDGDIERLFGVKNISKIPIPSEWNKRNIGRRLILFPNLSDQDSNSEQSLNSSVEMISSVERALIITTDDRTSKLWNDKLSKTHDIIRSDKIEKSLDDFVKSKKPSILLLERYDGIDLPGDQCRLMLIDSSPSAAGLQEKYFLIRLGASVQLKNRIRTRITQAMGRCTRDEGDYSVVIIYGNDITQWLCNADNTQEMHPELQAEISFGLDNSNEMSSQDFVEIAAAFLSRSNDWQNAEGDIRNRRDKSLKLPNPVNELLANSMKSEIDYTYNSWKSRHEDAFQDAIKVLSCLEGGVEIQPYRSFWQYQAATSAFLAWKNSGEVSFKNSAIKHLRSASVTSTHISWLGKLISEVSGNNNNNDTNHLPIHDCYIEIDELLSKWKIKSSKYDKEVAKVLENIKCTDNTKFELGIQMLGRMLGAKTYKWDDSKEQGAPDGLWIFGSWCAFVFEAKTDKKPENSISLGDFRQASTHEDRVRAEHLIARSIPCFTIIISPKKAIVQEVAILDSANNIFYVSHDEIIKLSLDCAEALDKIRSIASSSSSEVLTEKILQEYKERDVCAESIKNRLTATRIKDLSDVK
jgi:Type III restriction enzyme, res subunit